ncbi:glycosyltransferase family 4 protein [Anaerolinea sp.]|uniref:glycosyltransferase family 4 protein n=1 Tax=Anaerolinea sp. TaxID=1872519 RepID=UPI002ACE1BB3|nr:glycosyltransferase family 4 protein [Anaerolinea sp.]
MAENKPLAGRVRIALFTSQFPGKVSTFFARDVNALLAEGFKVDIFPIYPIQEACWQYVPETLRETIRVNSQVLYFPPFPFSKIPSSVREDVLQILKHSIKFGVPQPIKSFYVVQQGIKWAEKFNGQYDYLLAYWGNYAATYAYVAQKTLNRHVPFSFFLHAGTDLYRDQIFLEQKIQASSAVFTVCEFNKKFLRSLYPQSFSSFEEKLWVYHLGIDLEGFPFLPEGRKSNTILAVGSLYPVKGFHLLLHAFAKASSNLPDMRLVIVGDGPQKIHLQYLIRRLKLEDKVVLTGHLPFELVKEHMIKSTILVHPSLGLGDAVPTVIKEALALGLPVIGSDIAGIPELLDRGRCGVLVPSGDVQKLSRAIVELMANDTKRKLLANAGREWAQQRFDVKKNISILSDVILRTL